jgi:hypothetical protein
VRPEGVLPILLLRADGGPINTEVLNRVGLPCKIEGRLGLFYNWQVLYVKHISTNVEDK